MTMYGRPTNNPYRISMEDVDTIASPGGSVIKVTAGESLVYGDGVCLSLGGRAIKSLEASLWHSRFLGYVVGGQAIDNEASNDATLLTGLTMATVGQSVLVQTNGVCYGINDTTNSVVINSALRYGSTTAGEVISSQLFSYCDNSAGLAIKAGGSTLVKAVNIVTPFVAGVRGTATAANLDMAALSGTTANGKFAVYVFRVAADGTTVSSAKSADADSLAALLWPTGSAVLPTLGGVIINPTGTGGFVGGTTALDDATVVPNAVYFNLVGNRFHFGIALEAGATASDTFKLRF